MGILSGENSGENINQITPNIIDVIPIIESLAK